MASQSVELLYVVSSTSFEAGSNIGEELYARHTARQARGVRNGLRNGFTDR